MQNNDAIARNPTHKEKQLVAEAPIKKIVLAVALLTSVPAFADSPFFTPRNLVVAVEGCGVHGGSCPDIAAGLGFPGLGKSTPNDHEKRH